MDAADVGGTPSDRPPPIDDAVIGLAAEDLSRATRLVQSFFRAPLAMFSLLAGERRWVHAEEGRNAVVAAGDCGDGAPGDEDIIVEDAQRDPRCGRAPIAIGPVRARFYAGKPVRKANGERLGTLCIFDEEPRSFPPDQVAQFEDFARLIEAAIQRSELGVTREHMAEALDNARREALLCPMTELWNRRGFEELAQREASRMRRSGGALAAVMIDIDHFKSVNDTHGHAVGDLVIKRLGCILRENTRTEDVVARIGGEEFVVLMPDAPEEALRVVGDKLIGAVRAGGVVPEMKGRRFTASAGIARSAPDPSGISVAELLERADAALYVAKSQGRDRFFISGGPADAA